MKSFIFTVIACLCLIGASAWLIATPVLAASISITCANGSTLTCTGSSCVGEDAGPGHVGHCQCGGPNGSFDTKTCPTSEGMGGGGPGGGGHVPVLE